MAEQNPAPGQSLSYPERMQTTRTGAPTEVTALLDALHRCYCLDLPPLSAKTDLQVVTKTVGIIRQAMHESGWDEDDPGWRNASRAVLRANLYRHTGRFLVSLN